MRIASTPREEIRDVLVSYCRGVDRRDRERVRRCFHPEATDDHGTGPQPLETFLTWCFDLLEGYDTTFHLLGQSLYEFRSPAEASVETYGVAFHRTVGGPDHRNLVTGFRYVDIITDAGTGWRIARRRAISDWSRVDREGEWWTIPGAMLTGSAGPDDPSYADLGHPDPDHLI